MAIFMVRVVVFKEGRVLADEPVLSVLAKVYVFALWSGRRDELAVTEKSSMTRYADSTNGYLGDRKMSFLSSFRRFSSKKLSKYIQKLRTH